jgi:DNA mismatch repair protein MutL
MKIIKVLPEGLIDRIAAGEVIENPASVIKELVENSIDSGAANIEIAIAGGGKDEILIVDDGEGIPKDQVELAFYRHATSKIKNWDDLLKTLTMGFRGEALPSISSVSLMQLTTFYSGERTGTTIKFEGGKQAGFGPAPPRKGTAISVKNLFFNVPARRKFLKSELSEKRKISEIIRRYLIAHPEIGFKIIYDGRPVSSLPAMGNLRQRLELVWGNGVTDYLVETSEASSGPLMIRGFVSKPEVSRANRNEIFFFVNQRPVFEKSFFGAIAASYGPTLPKGRYPYAALFLDIEPGFVDINVHPAKTEVRFADEGFIFTSLKRTLDKSLALPVTMPIGPQAAEGRRPEMHAPTISYRQSSKELFNERDFSMKGQTATEPVTRIRGQEDQEAQIDFGYPLESYLQIFDTFIVVRRNDEMLIIDQHTAHERILFEKNLRAFDAQGIPSQRLLFEERIQLTPDEISAFEAAENLLTRAGFEFRSFGANELIISGVPVEMSRFSPRDALKETLAILGSNLREGQEIKRALAAAIACKAAVKSGNRLSNPEIKGMIADLLECNDPYRCPHGRPTIVVLKRDELEKIFRRK